MKFSELDGRRVALWGLGRETRALRDQLAARLPATVISAVIDEDTPQEEARAALAHADVLIRSPGVSIYKPLIQAARAAGLPVGTATGLWLAERGGRHVIGVTGTKGKSTTATIVAHLLRRAGMSVELAGNIGRPVIELIGLDPATWVVLELSSYQIADLEVGPEVALLTNLSREHTDWHGSEQRYRADKLRLFDLPGVRAAVRPLGDRGDWPLVVPAAAVPLRGAHNAQNVAAAVAAIQAAGLPLPDLPGALTGLEPLPHRLQTVHVDARGVEWVDDSISTTPASAVAAIEAFAGRSLVLIAGGADRAQDYAPLGQALALRREPTALVLLPDTGEAIAAAAAAFGFAAARMSTAGDMREATRLAASRAQPGAVILLSPAAPSFNAYRDFEERGDHFAALALRT
ncbi:UDP-N-acetylmuramoyl-L-alanine--D-glutamate ligase [Conexibacter sp. S30A1]|uniref:Mur ligase family protein n=1 Tax=Conexibacter sp. S30A1 TaxID=2937800 RepID=UPI00200C8CCF|nr:Mur ligase family protein [Conexibacter sp. S30A1]